MTLHCDLRFEASDARLRQPEIRIGFIPPIATTQALGVPDRTFEGDPLSVRRQAECSFRLVSDVGSDPQDRGPPGTESRGSRVKPPPPQIGRDTRRTCV